MPRVYQSLVIDAPVEKVWERIRNFHDFSWAPSVVESCVAEGEGAGTSVGCKRRINDVFVDTMITHSDAERRYQYSIEEGPSPVAPKETRNYVGDIHLRPVTDGNKTFAEYSAHWESDNADAEKFIDGVYAALLKDLAAQFK